MRKIAVLVLIRKIFEDVRKLDLENVPEWICA